MEKVFVDSDIILDLLAKREPFYQYAAELFLLVEKKKIKAYVSPIIITNLHYVLRKLKNKKQAIKSLQKLKLLVKILPATEYAVFTLQGEQISSDWHLEIDQWIAAAGYQRVHPYSFQYYVERFKGLDQIEESQLDVYMPVRKHIAGSEHPAADS